MATADHPIPAQTRIDSRLGISGAVLTLAILALGLIASIRYL